MVLQIPSNERRRTRVQCDWSLRIKEYNPRVPPNAKPGSSPKNAVTLCSCDVANQYTNKNQTKNPQPQNSCNTSIERWVIQCLQVVACRYAEDKNILESWGIIKDSTKCATTVDRLHTRSSRRRSGVRMDGRRCTKVSLVVIRWSGGRIPPFFPENT